MGRKHGRDIRLVHPAHTTTDCASCGARTKHALPLSERTYACTVCRVVSPRDKNSARVMLVRAGLDPALERMGASGTVLDTVAAFTDRYVARGRCPADDLPELGDPTGRSLLTGPGPLTGPSPLTGPGLLGDHLPPRPGKAASA